MIGYKWLKEDFSSIYGIENPWIIGECRESSGELKLCCNGYHACRTPYQSLKYIHSRFVIVEADDIQEGNDKFVARRMQVIKELPARKIMTQFALICTKNILHFLEDQYPHLQKTIKAIEENTDVSTMAYDAYATAFSLYKDDTTSFLSAYVAYSVAYTAFAFSDTNDLDSINSAVAAITSVNSAIHYANQNEKKEIEWEIKIFDELCMGC